MSEQERHEMMVKSRSVGMGLMETGMAWFWSDRRIARWTEVIGMEHIRRIQAQKRGILFVRHPFSDAGAGRKAIWYAGAGYRRLSPKR